MFVTHHWSEHKLRPKIRATVMPADLQEFQFQIGPPAPCAPPANVGTFASRLRAQELLEMASGRGDDTYARTRAQSPDVDPTLLAAAQFPPAPQCPT